MAQRNDLRPARGSWGHIAKLVRVLDMRLGPGALGQLFFFTTPMVRSIFPFVCGVYALQTRGATPMEAMKSANRAFQRGCFSSISRSTLFIRSVRAALGKPPKYSKASIKQRINVCTSQRLTKVTKRVRE